MENCPINSNVIKNHAIGNVNISAKNRSTVKIMELRNSKTLCDVRIIKENSHIYAHSCILAAGSSFLLNFFLNIDGWSVSKPLDINVSFITNCNGNDEMNCMVCASQIIDFLYCGSMSVDYTHIKHLLNIARNLELQELLDLFFNLQGCKGNVEEIKQVKQGSSTEPDLIKCNGKLLGLTSYETKGLKRQKETVHVERNMDHYNCNKCKLQFNSIEKQQAHQKVFHKKQFVCLSCDFKTFKLSYIVFHLLNIDHEGNVCSICLHEASDKKSLKEHLQDHKGDLPFKCHVCRMSFKVRKEWLQHMSNHGRESFICKTCESSFTSKSSLNSHLISHKDLCANYVCEICGFTALYKSIFERHSSKHNTINRKKFYCPVLPCSFSSYSKYNLKEHRLSHESKKSFTCDFCALNFTQERNLKRHVLTLHNDDNNFYRCFRCDYKNARVDKAKKHCERIHPGDSDALKLILDQHSRKKKELLSSGKIKTKTNLDRKILTDSLSQCDVPTSTEDLLQKNSAESCFKSTEESIETVPTSAKKSYILSETTGEFHIISENEGEQIPVASVTSTNVLTIGNFRKGTGSVTLNETTGVLTFNNINSESTGAVFLNESTGELSYINLGKESVNVDVNNIGYKKDSETQSEINELSGEINDDSIFDSFDMDIANEDSCDGFDDLDGLLFDPIDVENTDHLGIFMSNNDEDSPKVIPHLNETTGELSFDYIESQKSTQEIWKSRTSSYEKEISLEDQTEDSYRLLLNEVTGEFS